MRIKYCRICTPGLEQIRDRATHRDDVVGHRGRPVDVDGARGGGDDGEFFAGQFRQLLTVTDQLAVGCPVPRRGC